MPLSLGEKKILLQSGDKGFIESSLCEATLHLLMWACREGGGQTGGIGRGQGTAASTAQQHSSTEREACTDTYRQCRCRVREGKEDVLFHFQWGAYCEAYLLDRSEGQREIETAEELRFADPPSVGIYLGNFFLNLHHQHHGTKKAVAVWIAGALLFRDSVAARQWI